MQQWREGKLDCAIDGGESPLQVAERQSRFLDIMLSREDENTVLICMHGRAMRIFLCLLMQKPIEEMDAFGHGNLSLYRLRIDNGKIMLLENNNTDHLKDQD
jgi:probable phosphoglycerate mutase